MRRVVLNRNPICVECAAVGRTSVAVEVDHVIPREDGGPDSVENLQPLCSMCHARKTMQELNARRRP